MKLSVLMSIYKKENPMYFDKALKSIWDEQVLKPDEIILVKDGKLTDELEKIIKKWENKIPNILKVVGYEDNRGLGYALNYGLKYCNGEYIARMDTDDIALPQRFKKQIEFLKKNRDIDVVGSYIQIIDENNNKKEIIKYPLTHKELFKFFKKRDPLAHPSVMFKKSFFEKVKGYPLERKNQDTLLWAEGFFNGCKFANINKVLLLFRQTDETMNKRGNIKTLIRFLKLRMYVNKKLKYGLDAYIYNFGYFLLQLMPNSIKNYFYKKLR